MKCPECVRTGQRSKLYAGAYISGGVQDNMLYYDEDGQSHYHHQGSKSSQSYQCSNGHWLTYERYPVCPTCDYGIDESRWLVHNPPVGVVGNQPKEQG